MNSAAIGLLPGQREEQVAGLDRARVVGQARDFRRGGPVQFGGGHRLEQAPQFHERAGLVAGAPGSWFARQDFVVVDQFVGIHGPDVEVARHGFGDLREHRRRPSCRRCAAW